MQAGGGRAAVAVAVAVGIGAEAGAAVTGRRHKHRAYSLKMRFILDGIKACGGGVGLPIGF